jgi:3-deoxy-D-manno-octulosonic-acid transferase
MQRIALWLYSLVTWLATPLLLRKLRRRARTESGYGVAVGERLGRYPRSMDSVVPLASRDPAERFVWIHAVSLGETRAAAILLKELRALLPGMRLLLTHGTATGRAEGAKLLLPGDVQVWQPWDTPRAVRRFLRLLRPSIGILMETEVWPNLAAGCRAQGVPLVLANARLNEKSRAGALRLSWLSRPAYAGLAAVWAQTEGDAVVLLASSREGEEAMWLEALKQKWPPALAGQAQAAIESGAGMPVQWLVVPRHPQRFDEVQRLCEDAGLRVSRRSQWVGAPGEADVWLGDSLGEMALYYGLAHVAVLGGSFAPLGGQNLIEAAACGCPVVMGPHTFNFAEAARLAEEAGAAQRVADMAGAVAAACALAQDPQQRARLAALCETFTESHRGAALSTAMAVAGLLRSAD